MPRKYADMQARLIANSALSQESMHNGTPCWEWLGGVVINRGGCKYGKLCTRYTRGPRKGKVKTEYAHRVSLRVFRGRRLMKNMKCLHLCNNTLCINPMHLTGGTQRANIRQAVREGRHKPGTRNQYSDLRKAA